MTNLKLFIWTDYAPDYYGGLAFAIAEDEISARKLVEQQRGRNYPVSNWGELEVRTLDEPIARQLAGGG